MIYSRQILSATQYNNGQRTARTQKATALSDSAVLCLLLQVKIVLRFFIADSVFYCIFLVYTQRISRTINGYKELAAQDDFDKFSQKKEPKVLQYFAMKDSRRVAYESG